MLTNADYRAALLLNYRIARKLGAGQYTSYLQAKMATKLLPEGHAAIAFAIALRDYNACRPHLLNAEGRLDDPKLAWSLAWHMARAYLSQSDCYTSN